MPGWTANGIDPYGVQPDPIAADGMLFYKGFFTLLMSLHRYVSGDSKWDEPFEMIRDGDNTFSWSHSGVAAHLARQWHNSQVGCHCENTKIWPY